MPITDEQQQDLSQFIITTIENAVTEISQKASSPIIAYCFRMVDDYFATVFAGVCESENLNHTQATIDNAEHILHLIWEGKVTITQPQANPLYDYVYQLTETLQTEDDYESLRKIYENTLIESLKYCRNKGVFDKSKAKNAIAFIYYDDDFEDNLIFKKSLMGL